MKSIVINNEKDYKRLLSKLKYYKYYKFTNFNIVNNIKNKDIDIINKALNIKSRRKRIIFIYDELVKYLNEYYKEDLCKFENDKCFVQRQSNNKFGCCADCSLVKSGIGCPSSNVSCKLTYCKPALSNIKRIKLIEIPISRCLSSVQRFILRFDFFSTREQIINDLYFGIIYWYIGAIRKGLKVTFKRRKKLL